MQKNLVNLLNIESWDSYKLDKSYTKFKLVI